MTGGALRGAIAAEWTKLFSVRSTWWYLGVGGGLALAFCHISAYDSTPPSAPGVVSRAVFYVAQFPVVIVSTTFITSEYSTGSIRSTVQWIPARHRLLTAKAATLTAALAAYGALLAVGGILVSLPVLATEFGRPTTFGSSVSGVVAVAAYLALLGLLCLGLGTALRSAAGVIMAMFLILLLVPLGVLVIAKDSTVLDYFPGFAGVNAMTESGISNAVYGGISQYSRWVGLFVGACWASAALLAGFQTFRRRDA
nr:hypothetical protein [Kibdelosporangium sp. MJ126-NF4]CEL21721.1 putative integral membrane protein [Kibdelosporangium sp. MJ126-NF4]CTQ92502.1 putative integral membrane protein [Kibdelosporangium sp. MJ126-NF4]